MAVAGSKLIARYLDDIPRDRRLTRNDELRLAREIRAGQDGAVADLVESNLGFVVKLAARYSKFGVPLEDLINEGNLGLIEAAKRFDAERNVRFLSYAAWWIRRSILEALQRDGGGPLRVPNRQQQRWTRLRNGRRMLAQQLGREPELRELAGHVGERAELLARRNPHPPRVVGIDETSPERRVPVRDLVADPGAQRLDERLILEQNLAALGDGLAGLEPTERRVLVSRFGLDGQTPRTLQQVGDALGVSREWIRRVELRAIQRLRRFYRERDEIRRSH